MTTYDSSVGSLPKITPGSETADSVNGSPVQAARKRPVVASVAVLGLAALAAGGVIGGRRIAAARRPRSRWQRLTDRIR